MYVEERVHYIGGGVCRGEVHYIGGGVSRGEGTLYRRRCM